MPAADSYAARHPVRCAQNGCQAAHPGSKWDVIAADAAGWFHGQDGSAWCPGHSPEWVRAWRARRQAPAATPQPESEE